MTDFEPTPDDGWRAGVEKAIRRKEQERAIRAARMPGRAWKARLRAAQLKTSRNVRNWEDTVKLASPLPEPTAPCCAALGELCPQHVDSLPRAERLAYYAARRRGARGTGRGRGAA